MKRDRPKKIVLVMQLVHASWREFLKGFLDKARQHHDWNIRLIQSPDELTPALVDELDAVGTAGIVVCESVPEKTKTKLQHIDAPLVVIGMKDSKFTDRAAGTVFIRNDDEDIGRFGAEYLLSLGNFASWGFVPEKPGTYWSELRCSGFTERLSASGKKTTVFRSGFPSGSPNDSLRLSGWIKALPKPAAIMAAYDGRARQVLEACADSGIRVPQQVAVIGVDDDPILCDFSMPPLTSVSPDHAREGRIAAEALSTLIRRPHEKTRKTILSSAKTMSERESAAPIAPSASLVRRALAYIDRNCTRPLTASDVVRHLGVSRSLADLRFRETRGETIAHTITARRLEEVAKRLRNTRLSIQAISSACGFSNPNHLKNLFRRHYGKSMREWRNDNSAT